MLQHSRLLKLLGAATGIYLLSRGLRPRLPQRDKVAVITGGSRGLGFLIARELARHGCRIVIAARDRIELEKARDRLRLEGVPVEIVSADLTHRDEAERVIHEARRHFGGVDILVNNAGVIQVAPFEATHEKLFRQALDVIFWGTYHCTQAVIPHMRARGGGAIVNITSFGGLVAVPHLAPYVVAKFAQVGYSQALHAELKQHGITVTTVAPGTMRTGSHVQADFGGHARQEYAWFSLAASLPLASTDAERAARQIVGAMRRRAPFYVVGLPFKALLPLAGLAPGLSAEVLALMNRLLPQAPPLAAQGPFQKGAAFARGATQADKALRTAAYLGTRAARRFQELNPV